MRSIGAQRSSANRPGLRGVLPLERMGDFRYLRPLGIPAMAGDGAEGWELALAWDTAKPCSLATP
jgi:hypothetical protein